LQDFTNTGTGTEQQAAHEIVQLYFTPADGDIWLANMTIIYKGESGSLSYRIRYYYSDIAVVPGGGGGGHGGDGGGGDGGGGGDPPPPR
jgi:hypothetical protein